MDLTLTEEQALVATTARELLAARSPASGVRAMAGDPAGYSTALWKEMAELGWTGLALAEAHGGAGGSFLELCLVVEEMGRVLVPSPFVPTVVLGAMALARFGTADQQAAWLPGVVRGEGVIGYAGPGWGRSGGGVTATPRAGELVLDGTALFVPYAHVADLLLVVARNGGAGEPGPTVLLVEAATPGMTVETLDAVDVHRQCRVVFEGARVPAGNVLGGDRDGRAAVAAMTEHGAVATCAEMVGGAQQVLDLTVEYACDREQFGRPIGSFQAVQHHCADMAMDVLTSRFLAHEAQWRLAQGLDAAEEVSMAKSWVSDAYRRVCALGHQVHGAIGFTREHDLHLYLRHAVAAELTFGDADHHREVVATRLGL
ncbi:MAG: acyl-CoA/acyl-ACP dehydrogenase [Acidimicrobiia bacterium]|nr:acyl-CoA/acyl-ACP dehydrogenase [Acidimicrobiia bacterium]